MGWTHLDRLVFTGLYGSAPAAGFTLAQVVSVCDYLDHTILTADEIRGAATRLDGLVSFDGNTFWHTDQAVALCAAAMAGHSESGWTQRIPLALPDEVD